MRHDYEHETINRDRQRGTRNRGRDRNTFGWDERDRDRDRDEQFVRDDDRRRFRGRDPSYGPDAYRDGMPRNETPDLISSRKVEGTDVYDRNGEKLGSISTLMIDKRSGEIRYAVLKHSGGFLGLNESYYPLEWRDLTYDTRADGYGVDFTEDDLDRREGYDVSGRRLDNSHSRNERRDRDSW